MAKSGRPGGPGDGRTARSEATKAALIAAGHACLQEVGFAGASARAIAAKADVQQAQVFYHFGSVNGLLLAVLDEVSQRRRTAYAELIEGAADEGELADVAAAIIATDLESGDVSVLVEMIAGSRLDPALAQEVAARLAPWQQVAQDAVRTALPPGPLGRLVPVGDLAHAVVAGILGLELLALASGDRETPGRILDQAAGALALLDLLTPKEQKS